MGLLNWLFGPGRNERDGSSAEKALVVGSVAEEYDWLRRNCPGLQLQMQSLQEIDGKPFDVLTLRDPHGRERMVYFDISGFFGR